MLRSTVFRFTVAYLAAFALATALLGATVYAIAHRALERQLDGRIAAEISSLLSEYRGEGERGLRAVIRAREVARATNDLGYGLFDAGGRRVAGSLQTVRPRTGWQRIVFHDPEEGEDVARAFAVAIGSGELLVVAADRDALEQADDLILLTLAVTLVLMVVIGTIGAAVLSAYLRSRLSVIATSAEAIIDGDLRQRIPIKPRRDEFDRLGLLLNTMLDRITGLLENLEQVSSDVAHDLRMPLTRLRHNLEQGLDLAEPGPAIEHAIEQTDHLLALFGAILRLAEIEAGTLRQGFRPVDLGFLATELAESYGPAIEDGGRHLATRIDPTPAVDGDRELLAQAIINLLDNAQAHTPPGTRITLTVDRTADAIAVIVADDGPGVAPADRPRILRRFARLEASRHVPGHGLGLSLVAAIVRIHQAELVIGDAEPGLRITLVLPIAVGHGPDDR